MTRCNATLTTATVDERGHGLSAEHPQHGLSCLQVGTDVCQVTVHTITCASTAGHDTPHIGRASLSPSSVAPVWGDGMLGATSHRPEYAAKHTMSDDSWVVYEVMTGRPLAYFPAGLHPEAEAGARAEAERLNHRSERH